MPSHSRDDAPLAVRARSRQQRAKISSHTRLLSVLDLYTLDHPMLTAEQIMAALALSRGTAYRYIRELTDAGLLNRVGAAYMLGPRIIEMDYYIRQYDPVLKASSHAINELHQKFECGVLIGSYFSDRLVVSYYLRGSENITHGRGRAMPLFRGAGGKAILASMPLARQRKLYADSRSEIERAGLAKDWEGFRRIMLEIQKAGFAFSHGELDAGNIGLGGAIIAKDERTPPSCLCLLFSEARYEVLDKPLLVSSFKAAVAKINANLAVAAPEVRGP